MKDSDMPTPLHPEVQAGDTSKLLFDRRRLLQISAAVGGAAMLGGCAGGGRRATAALPGPVWPHQESHVSMTRRPVVLPPAAEPVVAQAPVVQEPVGAIQILPRNAWTRGQPRWQFSKPMKGVTRITVHHDANNAIGLTGTSAIAHRINSIREAHLRRGSTWVDIGYHYIIDPDGRVWEGRPIGIEGAHVASTNDHNLGIMLLGNFQQHRPTGAQLTVLDKFVAQQMHRHNVGLGQVYTHQELKNTECPGRNLQAYMQQTRASRGRLALLA